MGLKRNNSKSVGLLARMTQICGAPTGGEITEKNTKHAARHVPHHNIDVQVLDHTRRTSRD